MALRERGVLFDRFSMRIYNINEASVDRSAAGGGALLQATRPGQYCLHRQGRLRQGSRPLLVQRRPGCSSLLGALYEHGPFLINDNFASIIYNQYSWNQKANVVYIESPAQVGFSYTDGKAPTWNDDLVAKLNAKAIREFFNVWTEFAGRDTYISGESYAGIYVPTSSTSKYCILVRLHSTNDKDPVKVNLKGFAVGNGCTDPLECEFQNDYGPFLMQLFRDYGYITQEKFEESTRSAGTRGSPLPGVPGHSPRGSDSVTKVEGLVDGYNIYDAYRPCYEN
ncbi:uncharacterized protein LOC116245239 [Nymphaea colorata]|nr:uncharacterized protein LOC116245239 [Nymphaea colorata]